MMTIAKVVVKRLHPDAKLPEYAHPEDSGADVFSIEHVVLQPGQWKMISTGLAFELLPGWELQVRPKSGIANKGVTVLNRTSLINSLCYLENEDITVLNEPGTIDEGFIGHAKVILINLSTESYEIKQGQKIAQIVLAPVYTAEYCEVHRELRATRRGTEGFGSTNLW